MSVLESAVESFSARSVRHVRPVARDRAEGLVAEVYRQLATEFQVVPPITVHSPAPRLLAAVWSATRETLVAGEGRVDKEAIAAAVSAANACPFCVDVHSVMLEAGSQREVATALVTRSAASVREPAMRALVAWGLATPRPNDSPSQTPAFPRDRVAAYLGTAVVFHYVNRVVNVFMREGSPLALPRGLGWLRGGVARIAASGLGRATIAKTGAPGESLRFLAGLDVRSGIDWIDGHPTIGPALSRLFAVAREGGASLLGAETVAVLDRALDGWEGAEPPIGRNWLDEAVRDVHEADLAPARLALAVARASFVVDDEMVDAFRAQHPTDEALVRVVAFGAAAAARRVATWLRPPAERA